jgi:hypothetical protein
VLYLLDANVLITAHRDYYPPRRVPEFWSWLTHVGSRGQVKLPLECYEEISDVKEDALAVWVKKASTKKAIMLDEEADPRHVAFATENGYARDLTDDEIVEIGRDPFLIGYALVAPKDRCIVTTEVSKPSRQRANRHLPDVCRDLGVKCVNSFALLDALKFTTDWDK